ncbi:MAG: glycosyl hydrolase family 65 protein [Pirellulales bacterium]
MLLLACAGLIAALPSGLTCAELPRFSVPGCEHEMAALNALHELHHDAAFTHCTLWDPWLPMATVWASKEKRAQYRAAFLDRKIDAEGYVAMQQHRGGAHSDGWPFPAWGQCGGAGFYFSAADEAFAIQMLRMKRLTSTEGWEIDGADVLGIDPVAGLRLKATKDVVTITTPPFRCGTIVAPFARLEWAARGLKPESQAGIEWLFDGEASWPAGRTVAFPPPQDMQYANVPLYRQKGYAGLLTRYRVRLDHAAGAEIDLRSIITAIDTRHPITNPHFIRGCCDYVAWTGDLDFLRHTIGRMRRALTYALDEFRVRQEKHVFVPWVGHDGRSGIAIGPDGKKSVRLGLGVGNNYWDLLPFGGHDALATIYLHDALRGLASLEESIAKHPEWNIPADPAPHDASALLQLADEVRQDFQTRFWNRDTGRFNGWIDVTGRPCDYGFTVVNLEAVYYGLASDEQARSIFDWLDGRREVAGDTSRGADIYHWRFAPRATTRRNVENYVWAWRNPEQVPWGGQVQDGGAVLGFSYHDLMARLKTNGPDDAWKRLREILAWFREVQAEGGYRAYYAKPGRGTLQGGGTAGGLGLDHEFMESVLVPQVMLYGFLGFRPSAEGYRIEPRLPAGWPSLTVTGIRFHDQVLDVTAHADGRVEVTPESASRLADTRPEAGRRP